MAIKSVTELKSRSAGGVFRSASDLEDFIDTSTSMATRSPLLIAADGGLNWMAPQNYVSSVWTWYYERYRPVPLGELIYVAVNGNTMDGAYAPDLNGYSALKFVMVENTGFWDGERGDDKNMYVATKVPGSNDIITVIPKGVIVPFARTSVETVGAFGNVTGGWRPVMYPLSIEASELSRMASTFNAG